MIEGAAPAPRARKALGVFRGSVVVFYWITLPLALLMAGGWISSAVLVPTSPRHWLMVAGSLGFSALLIWRLWLNSRAIGRAGPFPSPRRFWRVYAPLGVLAILGLSLVALGIASIFIGIALARSPEPPAWPWLLPVFSASLMLGGAALCWPLLRLLLRKPAVPDSRAPEEEAPAA